MAPVDGRPIIKCGNSGCTLVRSLWWNMGTKLEGSQLYAEPVGRLSRARTSLCQTSFPSKVIRRRETTVEMSLLPRLDAAETPHLPCLDGQVWFPGVTHSAIKRYQKVRMQSWRTARSLIRLRSTGRSEQTTNCEHARWMNTNRSSTVTVSRRTCSRWMMRKLPYWQPRGNSYRCKVGSKKQKNYLERISREIETKQQYRLEILQKWIEADQELDAAHAKQVQAKHEMSILVAEQTAENAKAVNQGTSGIQSLSSGSKPDPETQQTILSVFKSVLSMQSMGCHSVAEQLMAAGATDDEVKKISQIIAQTVRSLEGGVSFPEPGIEALKPSCDVVVLDAELPSCIPGYSSMDIEGQEAIKRSLSNAAKEKRRLAKKCKQEEDVL